MTDWPILSTITFAPLVGALLILFINGDDAVAKRNIRNVALLVTSFVFLLSLWIWIGFDPSNAGFQFVEDHGWLGGNIGYRMGVDGISMPFVILTTFLMPIAILADQRSLRPLRAHGLCRAGDPGVDVPCPRSCSFPVSTYEMGCRHAACPAK